jgi:hypothetical protein
MATLLFYQGIWWSLAQWEGGWDSRARKHFMLAVYCCVLPKVISNLAQTYNNKHLLSQSWGLGLWNVSGWRWFLIIRLQWRCQPGLQSSETWLGLEEGWHPWLLSRALMPCQMLAEDLSSLPHRFLSKPQIMAVDIFQREQSKRDQGEVAMSSVT